MYLLGYDIGSSSVKACIVEAQSGKIIANDYYPKTEMTIYAQELGWAEQNPEMWWSNLKIANKSIMEKSGVNPADIKAIGISWQMHGLVALDKNQNVLRPSIIWCDSRAVSIGEKAFNSIGKEIALSHLLNSPGNFTASKLAWVKENEPALYEQIDKIMLPGDYIAMKLTGDITTTIGALSEGIFWDFKRNEISKDIMRYYGFSESVLPNIVPTFGFQGELSKSAAEELGLKPGIPIGYRAGDQPNNAVSLNVFNPGEVASTAGTSGVVYGVSDKIEYDPLSRANSFAHVNHTAEAPRIGVLLCINGTGILNSWIKRNFIQSNLSYDDMNSMAAQSPIGSKGVRVAPFGNGAERVLNNKNPGCSIQGVNFNIHTINDVVRASQEGIVFSFNYGIEIMKQVGVDIRVIKAGHTNMFLSPIFRETLANVTGATIELYDTDGAAGAAKAAGMGVGIYNSNKEAFASLQKIMTIEPTPKMHDICQAVYQQWLDVL